MSRFPIFILLMVDWLTPYSAAMSTCRRPRESFCLTSGIRASGSFNMPCSSPRAFRFLFLENLSSELSWCVPSNKWRGFTHEGLSQRWQMRFFGRNPKYRAKDTLWASMPLPLKRNFPYPKRSLQPVQTQQLCVFRTKASNLNFSSSVNAIDGSTESHVDEVSITHRIFRHSLTRVKRGMRLFFL